MRTIRIKLYKFSELSKDAKEKAIEDFIYDRIEYSNHDDYENWPNFKRAVDKAEEMYTPWFTASYVYDYCKNEIVDMLTEDTECKFTKDGKLN